jgi:hypothetical protein
MSWFRSIALPFNRLLARLVVRHGPSLAIFYLCWYVFLGAAALATLIGLFAVISKSHYQAYAPYLWDGLLQLLMLVNQFILLLPLGAGLILLEVYWRDKSIHAEALVFLGLSFPLAGGIILLISFPLMFAIKYNVLDHDFAAWPHFWSLASLPKVYGAPWESYGLLRDMLLEHFPFCHKQESTLFYRLFKIYSIYLCFSSPYRLWRQALRNSPPESGPLPPIQAFRTMTSSSASPSESGLGGNWRRGILSAFVPLLITILLLNYSLGHIIRDNRLDHHGVRVIAAQVVKEHNPTYYAVRFILVDQRGRAFTHRTIVDYPTFYRIDPGHLTIMTLPDDFSQARLDYTKLFPVSIEYSNEFTRYALVLLFGLGVAFIALMLFVRGYTAGRA